MLYTASLSVARKLGEEMKRYYVMRGYGNDEIAPDQSDLDSYRRGEMTWQGLVINYQVKLRQAEAGDWMRRVSAEAATNDIILVDPEEDVKRSFRREVAEMMASMFGGQIRFRYMGELKSGYQAVSK